jgi:hypothetical protein
MEKERHQEVPTWVVVSLMKRVIIAITTSEREKDNDGKAASYKVCRSNAEFQRWRKGNEKNSKWKEIIFIGHCK